MTIRPYPEEERCQNCCYSREISDNADKISCRYGTPSINSPYWPEIDHNAWCSKWSLNNNIKPAYKEIIYMTLSEPTCHIGHIETFTEKESIIRKRIKDAYPDAVFEDEVKKQAIDLSSPPVNYWRI